MKPIVFRDVVTNGHGQVVVTTHSAAAIASWYFPCEDARSNHTREQLEQDILAFVRRCLANHPRAGETVDLSE